MSSLLTTFWIDRECYGIEVVKVEEVTSALQIYPVPLAPNFVSGLINLRGQLATALGLRQLFDLPKSESQQHMTVVCRVNENLISLIVDSIGEVIETEASKFESPPDTMPSQVRKYVEKVYKMDGLILSVLDLGKIASELTPNSEVTETRLQAS